MYRRKNQPRIKSGLWILPRIADWEVSLLSTVSAQLSASHRTSLRPCNSLSFCCKHAMVFLHITHMHAHTHRHGWTSHTKSRCPSLPMKNDVTSLLPNLILGWGELHLTPLNEFWCLGKGALHFIGSSTWWFGFLPTPVPLTAWRKRGSLLTAAAS